MNRGCLNKQPHLECKHTHFPHPGACNRSQSGWNISLSLRYSRKCDGLIGSVYFRSFWHSCVVTICLFAWLAHPLAAVVFALCFFQWGNFPFFCPFLYLFLPLNSSWSNLPLICKLLYGTGVEFYTQREESDVMPAQLRLKRFQFVSVVEEVKGRRKNHSNVFTWIRTEDVCGLHQEVFVLMGNMVLIFRNTNFTSSVRQIVSHHLPRIIYKGNLYQSSTFNLTLIYLCF